MATSFSRSLRAVWMARWQELAPRLAFWLLLAGYDVRERSRSDVFYLPYLVAFWLVWAFAMFTAISGVLATVLEAVNPGAPAQAVVAATFWALVLWALFSLYRVTRRSPFTFSPADAVLLCQTPVDRRAVSLIWFLTEWPQRVLPFAFVALAGGFSLFEVSHVIESVNLPEVFGYWQEGLRALSIVLAYHFLALALLWAVGAWRLHGRWEPRLLRWLPLLTTLLVLPLLLSAAAAGPFALPGTALWPILTWPLQAAYGPARWLPAALAGLAAALAGLGVLIVATRDLNLSRAAQETSRLYEERFLGRAGVKQEARRRKQERQLGASGQTGRIGGSGWWVSVAKDMRRAGRRWRSALWSWLGLFALSLGVVVAPDWGTRLVALVFWVQVAGNRSVDRLGDNLSHWWLWRQQPFPAWQLVAASLAPPLLLTLALTLAAGLIGALVPLFPNFPIAPLLPVLSVVVAVVSAWDLLRKADPTRLLMGDRPGVSVLGWFLGLALTGTALGVAWFVARTTNFWWPGLVAAALLCLGAAAFLWSLVRERAGRLA